MAVSVEIAASETSDEVAELLAQLLREAVGTSRNSEVRQIAGQVGSAMLAGAGADTAQHSDDVVLITEAIGKKLGIAGEDATDLLAAAQLHDIGKACIPRDMLEKPGMLDKEEWRLMRRHTIIGERILNPILELQQVARLVRHSHERWDGTGYPDGLAGREIPLGSRIIFCADAFHAIRCDRPYRAGRSAREAVLEINRCASTQFDPEVTVALAEVVDERRRKPRGVGGSARLFALLMCLVIGGAGSAVARSDLLGTASLGPPGHQASSPSSSQGSPPACGTAACPGVAVPVGGLGAAHVPGTEPGPRPLFPGLPGQLHRASAPGQAPGKVRGKSAEAKARHAAKKAQGKHHGKAKGHSKHHGKGHANGHSNAEGGTSQSGSNASAPVSSGSSGGGGSSHNSGGHHSSGRRGSSRSHGSRGHGSGGNGNGGSNGNAGGNSGSHGK
jgi:HD domain